MKSPGMVDLSVGDSVGFSVGDDVGLVFGADAVGEEGHDEGRGGAVGAPSPCIDVNTPGVTDGASTMVRSMYLEIFPTSSFREERCLTSTRRSSMKPLTLGRHSSNERAALSKASSLDEEESVEALSRRSRPSKRAAMRLSISSRRSFWFGSMAPSFFWRRDIVFV